MNSILIVTGENSGEKYGAGLVNQYKKISPSSSFFGIGGNAMEKQGVHLLYKIEDLSLVGFFEILSHLPRIQKISKRIKSEVKQRKSVAAVFIDSPDFNLRLAKSLKKMSTPILYYVSPTVWAWREKRLKLIRKTVDKMLLIFPFEEEIYRRHSIPATYVGHPLKESIKITLSKNIFFKKYDLDPEKVVIAILPGSRKSEIQFHMPILIPALQRIKRELDVQFVLPLAENIRPELIERHMAHPFPQLKIINTNKYEALAYSHLAIASCGTVNLETALLGTPLISFYRISPLTYFFGIRLVKVKDYSIVNILAGKKIIPELIQRQFTSNNIYEETKKILSSPKIQEEMKAEFKKINDLLGEKSASKNAAQELNALIRGENQT